MANLFEITQNDLGTQKWNSREIRSKPNLVLVYRLSLVIERERVTQHTSANCGSKYMTMATQIRVALT